MDFSSELFRSVPGDHWLKLKKKKKKKKKTEKKDRQILGSFQRAKNPRNMKVTMI